VLSKTFLLCFACLIAMVIVTFSVNFFGRVQGIGFRFLALRKANSLGLTGWVKNSFDFNCVETILQGEKENINEFIFYFKENPSHVRVDNVVMDEIKNSEKFIDFQVRY